MRQGASAAPAPRNIKEAVRRLLGVPVCVGIAETRTLAKLANRAAKKIPSFDGVCVWPAIDTGWCERLMRVLPVSEVWGIASRLASSARSDLRRLAHFS